jgi:transcription elongation GreA/GreB family factor
VALAGHGRNLAGCHRLSLFLPATRMYGRRLQTSFKQRWMAMSRAFVKEDDPTGGTAVLPDRAISPHPNLVTRRGLRLIEAKVAEFERQLAQAADGDAGARASRELRYWAARLGSARLEEPAAATETVVFGTRVTGMRNDGQTVVFEIVGEDEAEPEAGRIAWTAPVARALLGGEPGEVRRLPKGEIEILTVAARAG